MTPNSIHLNRTRLMGSLFVMIGLWLLLTQPILASELPEPTDIDTAPLNDETYENSDGLVLPLEGVTVDGVGWCPSNANICRVNRQFTVDEIKEKLQTQNWNIWREGNQFIYAFRGRAPEVFVTGGIYTELAPVNNSDYWAASLQIANLDRAVISFIFGIRNNNDFQLLQETYGIWRGQHAPEPPALADTFNLSRDMFLIDKIQRRILSKLQKRLLVLAHYVTNWIEDIHFLISSGSRCFSDLSFEDIDQDTELEDTCDCVR